MSYHSFPQDAWLFVCYPNSQSYIQADCQTAAACLAEDDTDADAASEVVSANDEAAGQC